MACEPGSYVTGVPVRISEAFRPPRKVTLPASCPYIVDAELLTEEVSNMRNTIPNNQKFIVKNQVTKGTSNDAWTSDATLAEIKHLQ